MNQAETAVETPPKWLGWLYFIGGIIGIIASVAILNEKIAMLKDPNHVAACDISEFISCGSVMRTGQDELLGLPNPVFGIIGFAIMLTLGAAILAGGRFRGWFWFGVQLGLTLGMVAVHWFAYEAMFVIHALCPYCMVVWVVIIAMFVPTTAWNLKTFSGMSGGFIRGFNKYQVVIALVWIIVLIAASVIQVIYRVI